MLYFIFDTEYLEELLNFFSKSTLFHIQNLEEISNEMEWNWKHDFVPIIYIRLQAYVIINYD